MEINIFKDKCTRNIILYLIPLSYISIGSMMNIYSSGIPYIEIIRVIMTIVGLYQLLTLITKRKRNAIISILFSFTLLSCFPTLYSHLNIFPFTFAFLCLCDSLLWISIFTIFYKIGKNHVDAIEKSQIFIFLIPIFSIIFWNVKSYFSMNTDENIALISTAYYPLFILPFVFLNKNNITKLILILCVTFTILLSVKRTGFLVLVITIMSYCYFKYMTRSSLSKKFIFFFLGIILVTIFYIFMELIIEYFDLKIIDRLLNIKEDGGSGRDLVWAETWEMITNSNIMQLFFGHGFNMVYHNSRLELSAHCDYLEIIYDYGIFGGIIFTIFYYRLFKYLKIIKTNAFHLWPAFASSLILVLVFSISSHLIIYPSYFLYICAFWGLISSYCDKCKNIFL